MKRVKKFSTIKGFEPHRLDEVVRFAKMPLMNRTTKKDKILQPAGNKRGILDIIALATLGLFAGIICLLILSDLYYIFVSEHISFSGFIDIIISKNVRSSIFLSLITSSITLILILLTSVPTGWALSRCSFPGKAILETIVDVPILLAPVALGLSLLAFFGTEYGNTIRNWMELIGLDPSRKTGIVICQYLVSAPYCTRTVKAAFDSVDRKLELTALSLGCSRWGSFYKVTLPLASGGLVTGAIISWARAIGIYGPLMIVVGTFKSLRVMPTSMYLEMSVGNIEEALVIALISIFIAGSVLTLIHLIMPGRRWM